MYKKIFKRLIDVLFSLIGCIFLIPIFLVLAPIIYFTDKGPVFYNAPRIGKNGKPFVMYKFRSMEANAPDIRNADGSTYNGENDPRTTKIGRFMRKTSLDELPQLLNVLFGQMSLIGPRPNLPTKHYEELDKEQRHRLTVRPGITGYNQAYFRNSVGASEKTKNDNYYVDHLSFIFDIKILIKTVTSVLKKENVHITEISEKLYLENSNQEVSLEDLEKINLVAGRK